MVSGVKVDAFKPKEGVKIAANDSEAQSMAQSETNGIVFPCLLTISSDQTPNPESANPQFLSQNLLFVLNYITHWSATVMTPLRNIVSWMLSKDL